MFHVKFNIFDVTCNIFDVTCIISHVKLNIFDMTCNVNISNLIRKVKYFTWHATIYMRHTISHEVIFSKYWPAPDDAIRNPSIFPVSLKFHFSVPVKSFSFCFRFSMQESNWINSQWDESKFVGSHLKTWPFSTAGDPTIRRQSVLLISKF